MAMYAEETVQRVKEASDIVDIIGEAIELRRAGSAFKCVCPFHDDHKPSMTINPAMQIYKCFSCGAGGNVFTFMMEYHRMAFPEAVKALADRANIIIEQNADFDPAAAAKDREARDSIAWLNSQATLFFEEQLALPTGREAKTYLQKRGFTDETIRAWRLGWAPEGYDHLRLYLQKKTGEKWSSAESAAITAGLLREGDRGCYDFFRGRVMFPINDDRGRPVAFGGRILKEDPDRPVGKYMNSPETPVFSKSRVLFGLDAAHREIRATDEAVVVEGYTDVIMCHQYGLRNVVATLGTALTPDHVKILRRYAKRVIARFDADEAGSRATDRAIRVFMEADMPLMVVRSEGESKDACEFLPKFGAEAFRAEHTQAIDSFRFLLRQMIENADLRNLDEKAAAVAAVMDVVNLCPNAMKRDMMRAEVARTANVSIDTLPIPQAKTRRAGTPDNATVQAQRDRSQASTESSHEHTDIVTGHGTLPRNAAVGSARLVIEKELLGYMAMQRDWNDRVAAVVPPEEFSSEAYRELATEIHDAWADPSVAELVPSRILLHLPESQIARIVTDLFMQEGDERTDDRLAITLQRARMSRLQEERGMFMEELHEAQSLGDATRINAVCENLMGLDMELERLKTDFHSLLDHETLRQN